MAISIPHVFVEGKKANADDWNENFAVIADKLGQRFLNVTSGVIAAVRHAKALYDSALSCNCGEHLECAFFGDVGYVF